MWMNIPQCGHKDGWKFPIFCWDNHQGKSSHILMNTSTLVKKLGFLKFPEVLTLICFLKVIALKIRWLQILNIRPSIFTDDQCDFFLLFNILHYSKALFKREKKAKAYLLTHLSNYFPLFNIFKMFIHIEEWTSLPYKTKQKIPHTGDTNSLDRCG